MLDYVKARDSLFVLIDYLCGAVRNETAQSLDALRTKLREEAFNLVILGQFKRGKSTLINALIGEQILPAAIVPLTSIVTFLRYGQNLRVEIRYIDERMEEIELSALPAYITEKGNPENRKGVRDVTVFHPSPYLEGGVRIIDTPGAGSVYRHNTDVAYDFLPQVDAGIFVFSADPPLSDSEHRFLKDTREYVDKLFFVLNKIDQVSEEDMRESREFSARIIENDLGAERVEIHPVSARWALEAKKTDDGELLAKSMLADFERRLREFLVHEKGGVFLRSIIGSLMKLISDETISFRLEQEAIKLPLKELSEKIARFEREMKAITKERETNQYLLKGHLDRLLSDLDEAIASFGKEQVPLLQKELEKEYSKLVERGGAGLRNNLEKFIFDAIREIFQSWRLELTEKMSARLEEAHREFASKANEMVERILFLTGNIFELKLKPFTSVDPLSRKSEFYFMLKDDPVGLELIQLAATSALPGFLARKMILKSMKASLSELLDRHCGRVRYDLVRRLTNTVKDFQKALNEKIDLTLDGIRISFQKAIALHKTGKADVEKSVGEISGRLDHISTANRALIELSGSLGPEGINAASAFHPDYRQKNGA